MERVGELQDQGDLEVAEVLDLVADHQLVAQRPGVLLQDAQGLAAQVDFVVEPLGGKPLLVVGGYAVDVLPVVEEVGGPLPAQEQVLLESQQGRGEGAGPLFQGLEDFREQRGGLVALRLRRLAETVHEAVVVGEQGPFLDDPLDLVGDLQGLQPQEVVLEVCDLVPRGAARTVGAGQLAEALGAHRRFGALDDRADLFPHELGVVAAVQGVLAEDPVETLEVDQPLRGGAAAGGFQYLVQEVPEHPKHGSVVRCRARISSGRSCSPGPRGPGLPERGFQDGVLGEPPVDPLGEAQEEGVVGHEQAPPAGELRTQQVVHRDRGLAAARGAGQEQRRRHVQDRRLLLGQVQVDLEAVRIGLLQKPLPLFLAEDQPFLGGVFLLRLVLEPLLGVQLRSQSVQLEAGPLLGFVGLEAQERGIVRQDVPGPAADPVMTGNPPQVDRRGGALAAEGEQQAVAPGDTGFEDRLVRQAPELLDPHPRVPQAVGQELELLLEDPLGGWGLSQDVVFEDLVGKQQELGAHVIPVPAAAAGYSDCGGRSFRISSC